MFRRRRFFAGRPIAPRRRPELDRAVPDIAWFTASGEEMTEQDWDAGVGNSVTVFLNGKGITEVDPRGERVTDSSFLLCFNAHWEDIEMAMPAAEFGGRWAIVVDTAVGEVTRLAAGPGMVAAEPSTVPAAATQVVPARSMLVLQRME